MDRSHFIREGDVRDVIERSAYTTTLKDLEKRGKHTVRVVRARQIYRLIAEAVDRVVEKASLSIAGEEREELVRRSREQLDRILKERRAEEDAFREQQRRIEKHLRRELEGCLQRIAELRQANEELRGRVQGTRLEPAPPQVPAEFIESMLGRMSELRENMRALQEMRVHEASSSQAVSVTLREQEARFEERFQKTFDEAIARFSDQFDRKLREKDEKEAAKHIEAADVVLDALFSAGEHEGLESNIERVGVKRTTGGGIAANLERLKNLTRGKKGAPAKKPPS